MTNRVRGFISKFRKHRYVKMEEFNTLTKSLIPVHVCRKCGSRLYLDLWQVKQLPKDMKYGCSGRYRYDEN